MNIKINQNGQLVDVPATAVRVSEMNLRPSFIKLDDGTEVELIVQVLEAHRATQNWDDAGNPIYSLNINCAMKIEAPVHLRRRL